MKREYSDLLRQADHIFIQDLGRAGLYDKVSQAFFEKFAWRKK